MLRAFLRPTSAGSTVYGRVPNSPRIRALQPATVGRRKTRSKQAKNKYGKYISHVTFANYPLTPTAADTGIDPDNLWEGKDENEKKCGRKTRKTAVSRGKAGYFGVNKC